MAHSTVADIGLRNLLHGNGRLHPNRNVKLLERIRHAERIDGGGQHPHVVGAGPIHLAAAAAAPEVASAYHDGNLDAHLDAFLDGFTDRKHRIKINAVLSAAGEGFSAEL